MRKRKPGRVTDRASESALIAAELFRINVATKSRATRLVRACAQRWGSYLRSYIHRAVRRFCHFARLTKRHKSTSADSGHFADTDLAARLRRITMQIISSRCHATLNIAMQCRVERFGLSPMLHISFGKGFKCRASLKHLTLPYVRRRIRRWKEPSI